MRRTTVVLIIATLAILLVQPAMAQTQTDLVKITESVYAYMGAPAGTPGNAFSANAGIVIGKDAVLVVDTLTSAREAEGFATDIRKITDKPVRYVVNTHYHPDHALGNSFFADRGARIVGHVKCRDAIIARGDKVLEDTALFGLPPDFWERWGLQERMKIVLADLEDTYEYLLPYKIQYRLGFVQSTSSIRRAQIFQGV